MRMDLYLKMTNNLRQHHVIRGSIGPHSVHHLHKVVTQLHRLVDWGKHLAAHTLAAVGHSIGMALLAARSVILQMMRGSFFCWRMTDVNVCYASKKPFTPL